MLDIFRLHIQNVMRQWEYMPSEVYVSMRANLSRDLHHPTRGVRDRALREHGDHTGCPAPLSPFLPPPYSD